MKLYMTKSELGRAIARGDVREAVQGIPLCGYRAFVDGFGWVDIVIDDIALQMGMKRDIADVIVQGIETLDSTKLESSNHSLEAQVHEESDTLILTCQPHTGLHYFQFNAHLTQVYP